MPRMIALTSAIVLVAALDTAVAHASSPTAGTTVFDGTYRMTSATEVTPFRLDSSGHFWPGCGPFLARPPLTVINGRARYTGPRGRQFEAPVGPSGELRMQVEVAPDRTYQPPHDVTVSGSIDRGGTARARTMSDFCTYDLVWQKIPG